MGHPPPPSFSLPLVALLSLSLSLFLSLALAADIEQEWVISYQTVRPDGVAKLVPVVNGQYPGPTLRGRTGQTVRIVVRNAMITDTTSIHWHGLKQIASVWSDGVPGVTQCPIGPGESFVYEFRLDNPGTLWWHSHSALQKSSLYGALIVDGDRHLLPRYSHDRTLLLNDWFHDDATVQAAGLLNPSFRWVGDPSALLINGKAPSDCAALDGCKDCEDAAPFVLHVKPDTTYRLRLVGASSLAFLNFGIAGHKLTVVEAETTRTRAMPARFLDIGAGQSYSVLLKTKSEKELKRLGRRNNGNFWMQLNMRHRSSGPTGLGILRYVLPSTSTSDLPVQPPPPFPARNDVDWSLHQARRLKSQLKSSVPRRADRRVTLVGTQNRLGDLETGRLVWSINNITYIEPKTPVLHAVKLGVDQPYVNETQIPTPFNYSAPLGDSLSILAREGGTQLFKFRTGEVVDFVFQNTVSLGGKDEIHPWHLHLHNFWVLGFGDNHATWTQEEERKYKLHRAVERNTFNLYPNGWTAIRVRFDNPGIAYFRISSWEWASSSKSENRPNSRRRHLERSTVGKPPKCLLRQPFFDLS